MTETARDRLVAGFDVDPAKVTVIPHGAATPPVEPDGRPPSVRRAGHHRLLTWGLLGPGQGHRVGDRRARPARRPDPATRATSSPAPPTRRFASTRARRIGRCSSTVRPSSAIGGIGDLRRHLPRPRVADRAHPVGRSRGAAVRLGRPGHVGRARRRGRGRPTGRVDRIPARGRAPRERRRHRGAPTRSATRSAAAIRSVLTDPDRAASMAAEARRLAPDLSWAAVARRYVRLADSLDRPAHRGTQAS